MTERKVTLVAVVEAEVYEGDDDPDPRWTVSVVEWEA